MLLSQRIKRYKTLGTNSPLFPRSQSTMYDITKVQWTKNKYLTLIFTANLPYNYVLTKIRIPILKEFLPQ